MIMIHYDVNLNVEYHRKYFIAKIDGYSIHLPAEIIAVSYTGTVTCCIIGKKIQLIICSSIMIIFTKAQ